MFHLVHYLILLTQQKPKQQLQQFLPLSDAQMKHYKEKHPSNSQVNNDTEQQARLGSNVIYVPSLSTVINAEWPIHIPKPMCLLKYVFNCEQNFSYFSIQIIRHLD